MLPEELDDRAFHEGFANGSLPAERFCHRDHVRAGFLCLRRCGDLAAAAVEFRRSLRAMTVAAGVPDRYHETLTWAYLVLIHDRMLSGPHATSLAFLGANPDLLDHRAGALAAIYDIDAVTRSPVARERFLFPGDRRLAGAGAGAGAGAAGATR
jgi:hypothetical protein